MRRIHIQVGAVPIGDARTWAYPDGDPSEHYRIPTYKVTVSGELDDGKRASRVFEAMRFGVQVKGSRAPRVVGLADKQVHVIKTWLPHYRVHSARSLEQGAWQVYDNFLVHDGPDMPRIQAYASAGCVEICRGPRGFDAFNNYIILLSGLGSSERGRALATIGRSRQMTIGYDGASRPRLRKW